MHSTTHSVMFHHFHDDRHPRGQGALSADDFNTMLDWLASRFNLLSAGIYREKAIAHDLEGKDICLSFDDALLCQYDIAAPILNERNLKAFFFVYSSPLNNEPDFLEIFRYFRTVAYPTVDEFYAEFFPFCKTELRGGYLKSKAEFEGRNYLVDYPYYSENDRWFRYLRDDVLGKTRYEHLMVKLLDSKNFNVEESMERLWMTNDHVGELASQGHEVGLHSYSHPMAIHTLSYDRQMDEYAKNHRHLRGILGETDITAMSHPCGNYNGDTLKILGRLGVNIGFRDNMGEKHAKSLLEIPRESHANVAREIGL